MENVYGSVQKNGYVCCEVVIEINPALIKKINNYIILYLMNKICLLLS